MENDEFTTSYKISKFLLKFFTWGSDISVSIGKALDVVGNYVDENGNSIDQKGNKIDLKDYFLSDGEVTENKQREHEYNRILGQTIVREYHRINRVFSSHLIAFTAFRMLGKRNSNLDIYSLLRISQDELVIDYFEFKKKVSDLLLVLKQLHEHGKVDLADHLFLGLDEIIKHGLKNLGMYHAVRPLVLDKQGHIKVQNMNLLYFYHNKLIGYELEKHV